MSVKQNKAATMIQSRFRGFFAKKTYQLHPLQSIEQTDYGSFLVGSDPEIMHLPRHAPSEKILLVAAGAMKALELACQLGGGAVKIMLVDNSRYVNEYWKKVKEAMQFTSDADAFIAALGTSLHVCHGRDDVFYMLFRCKYLNQDTEFYNRIFSLYSFDRVKKIVLAANLLVQSFADTHTFITIAKLCKTLNYDAVYAYPSNIISMLSRSNKHQEAQLVMENLQRLEPDLAIHTRLLSKAQSACFYSSGKAIVTGNHDLSYILNELEEGVDSGASCCSAKA